MVAASYVVGWMTEGGSSGIAKIISSFVLGNIVIYAFGILQLVFLYGFEPFHAFLVGGLPFIAGDLVKIAVAAGMYSAIRGRLREIF
jgi:biotin transport system substrate-specific component